MSQGGNDVLFDHPVSQDPERQVAVSAYAHERKAVRAALNHSYGLLAEIDKVPPNGPEAAKAAWDDWNALFPATQAGNPHREG